MKRTPGESSTVSRAATPQISVVMPVHNALPYLDEAIESILSQTWSDFEFVILDDASTDGSTERLEQWQRRDSRIRLIRADSNLGPSRSSDKVARAAIAPIVARMDADDISYPDRLVQQFAVLREHPDVGVVASLFDVIDGEGRKIRGPELWRFTRGSDAAPFAHGAIMYRQSVFLSVGGYRPQCDFWEDKDLLIRMASASKVMIIPRSHFQVRQCATSTRVASDQSRVENAFDLMFRSLERVGRNEDYQDLLQHSDHTTGKIDPRAVLAVGRIALWAGLRPRLVERLFDRAKLTIDVRSLRALGWAWWAQVSPSTLRFFLLLGRRLRTRLAGPFDRADQPILWSPPWQRPNSACTDSGKTE